jgi:hypothetical protein
MQVVRLSNRKICIYVRGEQPPHFRVRGPNSNGSVVIATLELLAGKISRNDLDEVRDWASEPANLALLLEVWRKLHELD